MLGMVFDLALELSDRSLRLRIPAGDQETAEGVVDIELFGKIRGEALVFQYGFAELPLSGKCFCVPNKKQDGAHGRTAGRQVRGGQAECRRPERHCHILALDVSTGQHNERFLSLLELSLPEQ